MVSLFPKLFEYSIYGPAILRLALAAMFLAHGLPKWKKESAAQFAGWLEAMGFKPGKFWAYAVALAEAGGGILLLIGSFTQLAAIILIIEFLVIIFWVRRGQPFIAKADAPRDSRELDFLILMMLLALLVLGPGAWALDLPL